MSAKAAGALAAYCLDHEPTRELYETQPRCLLISSSCWSRWVFSCTGPKRSKPRCA